MNEREEVLSHPDHGPATGQAGAVAGRPELELREGRILVEQFERWVQESRALLDQQKLWVKEYRALVEQQVKEYHALVRQFEGWVKKYGTLVNQSGRRKSPKKSVEPPRIDAFQILRDEGEEGLRKALAPLELTDLRAILLAYGLDPEQKARKWKKADKMREHIVHRLLVHFRSGEVFLRA